MNSILQGGQFPRTRTAGYSMSVGNSRKWRSSCLPDDRIYRFFGADFGVSGRFHRRRFDPSASRLDLLHRRIRMDGAAGEPLSAVCSVEILIDRSVGFIVMKIQRAADYVRRGKPFSTSTANRCGSAGAGASVLRLTLDEIVDAGIDEVAIVVRPGQSDLYVQAAGSHAGRLVFF